MLTFSSNILIIQVKIINSTSMFSEAKTKKKISHMYFTMMDSFFVRTDEIVNLKDFLYFLWDILINEKIQNVRQSSTSSVPWTILVAFIIIMIINIVFNHSK